MPEYVFMDGPLAGQTTSLSAPGLGEAILVEVAGYDEDPTLEPGLTYVVDTGPSSGGGAGQLRFRSLDPAPHPDAAA